MSIGQLVSRNMTLAILTAFTLLLAMVAIVVIILRAPSTADQLTLIGAIIAFTAPLVTSLIALLRAETAASVAKDTQAIVNGHIDEVTKNGTPPAPGV